MFRTVSHITNCGRQYQTALNKKIINHSSHSHTLVLEEREVGGEALEHNLAAPHARAEEAAARAEGRGDAGLGALRPEACLGLGFGREWGRRTLLMQSGRLALVSGSVCEGAVLSSSARAYGVPSKKMECLSEGAAGPAGAERGVCELHRQQMCELTSGPSTGRMRGPRLFCRGERTRGGKPSAPRRRRSPERTARGASPTPVSGREKTSLSRRSRGRKGFPQRRS